MPKWPTLFDYQTAIQNPSSAFSDVELQSGQTEIDRLGLPKARTGQFACVYQVQCGQRNWAVRCFSQELKDQRERYEAISEHLKSAKLPYTVGFEYLAKGIRVGTDWYPILKMEWVQGDSLPAYIQKHAKNPVALRKITNRWAEMIQAMQLAEIAHGDLQHGNILIVQDNFKLVDYDGMYVPGLSGRRSLELGHRNYQHPRRSETDFGLYLDNFSAWVIYFSLAVLSLDSTLQSFFNTDNEFILFQREDFASPNGSKLLARLEQHSDPNLRSIATLFRSILAFEPWQVPTLDGQVPAISNIAAQQVSIPSWVKDHVVAGNANAPLAKHISSRASTIPPGASWVHSLLTPLPPEQYEKFEGSRIFLQGLGLFTLILFVALGSFFFSSAFVPDIVAQVGALLPVIATGTTASILLFFNFFLIAKSYDRESVVREMQSLKRAELQEKTAVKKLEADLSKANRAIAALQASAAKERQQIATELNQLRFQEQKEQGNAKTILTSGLTLIQQRRSEISRNEQAALAQLQSTIGLRLQELNRQINALQQQESQEIQNEIQASKRVHIDQHLSQHSVDSAPLAGLKYASRSELVASLKAAGIYTARDISYARVDAVRGFGVVRTGKLVAWRNALEQEALQTLPYDLQSRISARISSKYILKKDELTRERDREQTRYTLEEQSIKQRFSQVRLPLEPEQKSVQAQADRMASEISARYAPQYAAFTKRVADVETRAAERQKVLEEKKSQIQKQMFSHRWKIGEAQNNLSAYQRISFENYLRYMFGIRNMIP